MFSIERLRRKLVRGRPETFDRCVGISKLALQNYLQPSRLSRNSHSSQKLSCTIHFRIVVLFQPRNSWHDDHRTAQFWLAVNPFIQTVIFIDVAFCLADAKWPDRCLLLFQGLALCKYDPSVPIIQTRKHGVLSSFISMSLAITSF